MQQHTTTCSDWRRLTRKTLPDIKLGDCWFTTGIHAPNEDRKHLTDAETLQKHIAVYGDTVASWWKPATPTQSE